MATKKYNAEDIADWKAYEEVRAEGRFNMFDPNARTLTGLSRSRYAFVMDNYSELKAAAESQ